MALTVMAGLITSSIEYSKTKEGMAMKPRMIAGITVQTISKTLACVVCDTFVRSSVLLEVEVAL
jgi:hypothetical protein